MNSKSKINFEDKIDFVFTENKILDYIENKLKKIGASFFKGQFKDKLKEAVKILADPNKIAKLIKNFNQEFDKSLKNPIRKDNPEKLGDELKKIFGAETIEEEMNSIGVMIENERTRWSSEGLPSHITNKIPPSHLITVTILLALIGLAGGAGITIGGLLVQAFAYVLQPWIQELKIWASKKINHKKEVDLGEEEIDPKEEIDLEKEIDISGSGLK